MVDSSKITMKLKDIGDTLAEEGHEEWNALGKD